MYRTVLGKFVEKLKNGDDQQKVIHEQLLAGQELIERFETLSNDLRALSISRPKKIEHLRATIAANPALSTIRKVPLPLAPEFNVTGIKSEDAYMFKSALVPLMLTLYTAQGPSYGIIFKNGDDLRQDQLVLQMIRLMDRLLKKENLDLRLTPYGCLAASSTIGMLEKIESVAVAKINSTSSISSFLRGDGDSIAPEVMDNYVRSCAGYSVITYLLGVGDRHLDNLLITTDGHLFHVDFGYILGRDPKPYPPPMKLTKGMMEAMGGPDGEAAGRFRSHCYNCFLILRKNANLIINLFALMTDSNVSDIAMDRERTVSKIQDKFKLDLDDEQAVKYFQDLLESSIAALFPQIVEQLHTLAQYFRK